MNFMKVRLLLALLIIIMGRTVLAQSNAGYSFTVEQGKVANYGAHKYLIVPVTLSNNTNQTLSYYSLSCSWWDFYKFDSQELIYNGGYKCADNAPVLLTLAPHQQYKNKIELLIKPGVKAVNYKIGFNLIMDKAKLNLSQLKSHKPNVIWSNTLSMKI